MGPDWLEIETEATLNNGDGLCYYDLHKELVGLAINTAVAVGKLKGGKQRWRVQPNDPIAEMKDLRAGVEINRNRDMNWQRTLDKKSGERRIGIWLNLHETVDGLALTLTDEDGNTAGASAAIAKEVARDAARAEAGLRENLGKLGTTIFRPLDIALNLTQPWFVPASTINALRRDAVDALEAARRDAFERLPRAQPRPAIYPEDSLSYLGNVFNGRARDFYARHGVKLIAAAYESHEEEGEVSLIITKHCVRYSRPVPETDHRRHRCAWHRACRAAQPDQRQRETDAALRLQGVRDACGRQTQTQRHQPTRAGNQNHADPVLSHADVSTLCTTALRGSHLGVQRFSCLPLSDTKIIGCSR